MILSNSIPYFQPSIPTEYLYTYPVFVHNSIPNNLSLTLIAWENLLD